MLPTKIDSTDKVLIVDDTKTIVQILTMILKKENFEVFTAASGEEAIELLQNISVDTILMDIQMGKGIDGFEACRRIKQQPKTKDIPVIFLTAFDDLETKLKGFEVGGVDFVAKSFDKTEILTRIKNQTKLFKLQTELKRGLAYIRAILDAQKHMIAIFDMHLRLEHSNQSFNDIFNPDYGFSLISKLSRYDGYELPTDDIKLFGLLSKEEFKAQIKGLEGIFSLELADAQVLGESKKILTISNITIYEMAKKQELELLKYQERYHNTQQQDAFKKQKKIIRDEISHLFKNDWLFDSYYKPLDILSGDTLGAVKITEDRYLFYIVDAMGKGLSASVTSIQSTSFINNSIERATEHQDFNLQLIVDSFCHFIRKQLLDDELLCVAFLEFDLTSETIKIANYGMPPILIEENGAVSHIRPNNPPIMQFLATNKLDTISLGNITKIAMYSDGLNETEQKDGRAYAKNIEQDFGNSMLLRQFLRKFDSQVEKLDDDLTLIYISKLTAKQDVYQKRIEIAAKITEVIWVSKEIEKMLNTIGIAKKESEETLLIFSELIMNAFEHGALKLTPSEKQKLIEDDEYEDFLANFDNTIDNKQIFIELCIFKTQYGATLLKISIEDPGSGFEFSEVLKTIYVENVDKYSGRGVWMANDVTDGVFFSETGNKTTFFKTIKKEASV
jgi:two-component system, HptB-dependent secretion and biofilm response regulator